MPVPAFVDIGKATKEILYGGKEGVFQFDQKLSLVTKTATGITFTTSAVKKGDTVQPSLKVAYASGKLTADATINQTEKVAVNTSFADLAPGLKLSGSVVLPDPSSGKLKVDYTMPYVTLQLGAGLTSAPAVDAAVSTGYKNYILGGDVAYNTGSSSISKWSVGAGIHAADWQVGVFLLDKGTTLKGSVSHNYSPSSSWAAEVVKKTSGGDPTFAIGLTKKLGNGALTKYKVDNTGVLSALYETKLTTGEKVGLSTQIDCTNLSKPAKTGFLVELN